MLEEWTYIYKPRPWHLIGPMVLVILGWLLIHTSGILENWFCMQIDCPGYENNSYGLVGDWFVAIVLWILALLYGFWIAWSGIVQAEIQRNYEATGENWGEARIHIIKNNRKWTLWAKQILAGRPLTQTLWTGTGKLFARGEYEKRMIDMWTRGVLDYTNGQTSDQGYSIAGEAGIRYIQAMAEGRDNLPNPPLPSPARRLGQNVAIERTYNDAYQGEGGG